MAVSKILDHRGQPFEYEKLRDFQSGPTIGGVRAPAGGHPAQGLTPQRLAAILVEAENASPIRYLELAEEMEEKDGHYLGVLGTRKRAVSQLEITVEAGSDDKPDKMAADMVREWLKRDELESDLFDILDGVGKGFSQTRIHWDLQAREWTPATLEYEDPRFFTFDPADGKTPLLVDGGASGENPYGQPLPAFGYINHTHKAKSGLPIRGGLARPVAWTYLFKNYSLKDWVAFCEIFGMPIRVGKYGAGETEENIRRLMSAVTDISADAAAVIPASMMIEFVTAQNSGSMDLWEKLCDYCDRQVSKATLGQTATTDADTGGMGSGKEHGDVRKDIMFADAKQLAATLNRDLINPYARLNIAGLVKPPRLKIGQAEAWDPTVMMPAVKIFVEMGGKVGMSTIGDKLGLEEPDPDEVLLTAPATAGAPVDGAPAEPGRAIATAPPQNAPQKPGLRLVAPVGAEKPEAASSGLLEPLNRPSDAPATPHDALDTLSAASTGDWRPMMRGLLGPIEDLVAGATSLEDVRAGLVAAMAAMDSAPITERLARAAFSARLAGVAGVAITEEDA